MINAKELRVGNLVTYGGEIKVIENGMEIMDGKYTEIELMTDWLLAVGFHHSIHDMQGEYDQYATIDNFILQYNKSNGEMEVWHECDDPYYSFGYPIIKTMHRLQNYYFAATGKELTYTP